MEKPQINYITFQTIIGNYNLFNNEKSVQIIAYFPSEIPYIVSNDNKQISSYGCGTYNDLSLKGKEFTCSEVADLIEEYQNKLILSTSRTEKIALAKFLRQVDTYNEWLKKQYLYKLAEYHLAVAAENFGKQAFIQGKTEVLLHLKDKDGLYYYRFGKDGYYGNGPTPWQAAENYLNAENSVEIEFLKQKYDFVPKKKHFVGE